MEHKSLYEGVIEDDAYSVKAEFEKLLYEKFDKFVEELKLFEDDNLSLGDIVEIIIEVIEDIEEDSSEEIELEDNIVTFFLDNEKSTEELTLWLDEQDFVVDYTIDEVEGATYYVVAIEIEEMINEARLMKVTTVTDGGKNIDHNAVKCADSGQDFVNGDCRDRKNRRKDPNRRNAGRIAYKNSNKRLRARKNSLSHKKRGNIKAVRRSNKKK